MSAHCPHCEAALFTPNATRCAVCELDPRVWSTTMGDLQRVWIYDRVKAPDFCCMCGGDSELEKETLSFSADPPELRNRSGFLGMIGRVSGMFGGGFSEWFADRVETTGDLVELSVFVCQECRSEEQLRVIGVDLESKRAEIFACPDFCEAVGAKPT